MDPNLFHLDWERTFEVLAGVVILAFFIERALSLLFENRAVLRRIEGRSVKEIVSFAVSIVVCWWWHFDAVSMVILRPKTGFLGEVITAGVIAGGSKAAVKLFRDILGFRSTAYSEYQNLRQAGTPTREAAELAGSGKAPAPVAVAPAEIPR